MKHFDFRRRLLKMHGWHRRDRANTEYWVRFDACGNDIEWRDFKGAWKRFLKEHNMFEA